MVSFSSQYSQPPPLFSVCKFKKKKKRHHSWKFRRLPVQRFCESWSDICSAVTQGSVTVVRVPNTEVVPSGSNKNAAEKKMKENRFQQREKSKFWWFQKKKKKADVSSCWSFYLLTLPSRVRCRKGKFHKSINIQRTATTPPFTICYRCHRPSNRIAFKM